MAKPTDKEARESDLLPPAPKRENDDLIAAKIEAEKARAEYWKAKAKAEAVKRSANARRGLSYFAPALICSALSLIAFAIAAVILFNL